MTKALWNSGSRKEAMDLLAAAWPILDDAGRDRLAKELIAGPPDALLRHLDEEERDRSRDRRIFDRLIVLERVGDPPLTQALLNERERLRARFPEWKAEPGEQAHFGTWMGWRWGPDTRHDIDDLKALDNPTLVELLRTEDEFREGFLEEWRQLALDDPLRALTILEGLAHAPDPVPDDVWHYGLWGLREGAKDELTRKRLLQLLIELPEATFTVPVIANNAAEVLDAVGRAAGAWPLFWHVFDRTLPVVARAPENSDEPEHRDWVSLAINRSLGRLAGAFFNAVFGRNLKVGQGIPDELRSRLDALVRPGERAYRLARVIAASRLSYLFAVDPDWTSRSLVPGLNWSDEGESLALWQGFAWQARIDPQLWAALKPHFLPLFTEGRLRQIGDFRRNIGQLLMLVGIEFGPNELPRDDARNAIRAMPDGMRADAVAWLAGYLEQLQAAEPGEDGGDVDVAWKERVAPWLRRIWPADPGIRTPATSEQFGLAALSTNAAFAEAISLIDPLVVRSDGFYLIHRLGDSKHPYTNPRDALRFIDLLVDPGAVGFGTDALRSVLDLIAASAPELCEGQTYRNLDELLRVRGAVSRGHGAQ